MTPKTVRVRIAVAVDPSGRWNASGWSTAPTGMEAELAIDGVGEGERLFWVEADLPIPVEQVVEGQVSE